MVEAIVKVSFTILNSYALIFFLKKNTYTLIVERKI